jgi:1-hydroxycarotenoid 3,4-desaturase
LWSILSKSFTDARLRQLYGRYATYCGSSPYLAPATLRLIAHVEQQGVWSVRGGMHQLARALADLIEKAGGRIRYSSPAKRIDVAEGRVTSVETSRGETIPADAVIANVDTNALATGLFGAEVRRAVPPTRILQRSLSAVTFAMVARTEGFDLSHHNVFFSRDYRAEFDDLAAGRIPREPTIYVCAQDRVPGLPHPAGEPEKLLVLINAPPKGDTATMTTEETASCQAMTFALLARHGLRVRPEVPPVVTTPDRFEALFPATGGGLYGQATHGAMAAFTRPSSRSAIRGLYLTGGSVHPGAGVPMAALSGRIAASSLLQDWGLPPLSPLAVMPGGMSMP